MSQTSTRVGWNGGLGGWAERQSRVFMAFALCPCFPFGAVRFAIAPYGTTSFLDHNFFHSKIYNIFLRLHRLHFSFPPLY